MAPGAHIPRFGEWADTEAEEGASGARDGEGHGAPCRRRPVTYSHEFQKLRQRRQKDGRVSRESAGAGDGADGGDGRELVGHHPLDLPQAGASDNSKKKKKETKPKKNSWMGYVAEGGAEALGVDKAGRQPTALSPAAALGEAAAATQATPAAAAAAEAARAQGVGQQREVSVQQSEAGSVGLARTAQCESAQATVCGAAQAWMESAVEEAAAAPPSPPTATEAVASAAVSPCGGPPGAGAEAVVEAVGAQAVAKAARKFSKPPKPHRRQTTKRLSSSQQESNAEGIGKPSAASAQPAAAACSISAATSSAADRTRDLNPATQDDNATEATPRAGSRNSPGRDREDAAGGQHDADSEDSPGTHRHIPKFGEWESVGACGGMGGSVGGGVTYSRQFQRLRQRRQKSKALAQGGVSSRSGQLRGKLGNRSGPRKSGTGNRSGGRSGGRSGNRTGDSEAVSGEGMEVSTAGSGRLAVHRSCAVHGLSVCQPCEEEAARKAAEGEALVLEKLRERGLRREEAVAYLMDPSGAGLLEKLLGRLPGPSAVGPTGGQNGTDECMRASSSEVGLVERSASHPTSSQLGMDDVVSDGALTAQHFMLLEERSQSAPNTQLHPALIGGFLDHMDSFRCSTPDSAPGALPSMEEEKKEEEGLSLSDAIRLRKNLTLSSKLKPGHLALAVARDNPSHHEEGGDSDENDVSPSPTSQPTCALILRQSGGGKASAVSPTPAAGGAKVWGGAKGGKKTGEGRKVWVQDGPTKAVPVRPRKSLLLGRLHSGVRRACHEAASLTSHAMDALTYDTTRMYAVPGRILYASSAK